MEIKAQSKHVRVSPRKVRVIAATVKKLPLAQALSTLDLLAKKGAKPLIATIKSAMANAGIKKNDLSLKDNTALDMNKLRIKNITVDEGMKMKRYDKSHGFRYSRGTIQKRTSHITVILEG